MSRTGALLLLTLWSCGAEPAAPAPLPPLDFSAFDAALAGFVADHSLTGATAVVVHRDRGIIHSRGFGSHDINRVSLIASSSKILTAGILLQLADRGLLDLDKPISTYLGAWGQHKTDITLAQLLSNSSGMVGLSDDPTYGSYLCQYLYFGTLEDCGNAIYTAKDDVDRVPPDSKFRYGGGQWQLAGAIAEVVSGRKWADLVEETYRKPCGLAVLGYSNHFSDAFNAGGGVQAAFGYPPFFHGDVADLPVTQNPNLEGGAYTTVTDYGEILLMHLRKGACSGGRVLSEAAVARMQGDRIGEVYGGTTPDPTLPGYGLGWWVSRQEPGYVADPGAYGAMPWLDLPRGYGAMILLEAEATLGAKARLLLKPVLDQIFDNPRDSRRASDAGAGAAPRAAP